jgi:hypothetical protein
MHHTRAITAAIAASIAILGLSNAHAADPASQPTADAAQPATQGEAVLKTKTRSNQSNDRAAAPAPPKSATDTAETAEVLKSKTKSNQSNDRAAPPPPPPASDPADAPEPAEVLKTKTKSNQSND